MCLSVLFLCVPLSLATAFSQPATPLFPEGGAGQCLWEDNVFLFTGVPADSQLTAEVYSLTELSEWIPLGQVTVTLSTVDGSPSTLPLRELKGCTAQGSLTLTCSSATASPAAAAAHHHAHTPAAAHHAPAAGATVADSSAPASPLALTPAPEPAGEGPAPYHSAGPVPAGSHLSVIVRVLSAAGLQSMDRNGLADPWVKLKCNGEEQQTSVVKNSLNPRWSDKPFLFSDLPAGGILTVEMYDWNAVGSSSPMGQATVPLKAITGAQMTLPLEPLAGSKSSGTLTLLCSSHVLGGVEEGIPPRVGGNSPSPHAQSAIDVAKLQAEKAMQKADETLWGSRVTARGPRAHSPRKKVYPTFTRLGHIRQEVKSEAPQMRSMEHNGQASPNRQKPVPTRKISARAMSPPPTIALISPQRNLGPAVREDYSPREGTEEPEVTQIVDQMK
eukprot:SAG25_NODE_1728_length_2438_cov_4.417028_1_plen_443_part_10